jgi:hypothetical protein
VYEALRTGEPYQEKKVADLNPGQRDRMIAFRNFCKRNASTNMSLTSSGRSLSCITLIMVIQSTIVCCQSATNDPRTSKVHFSVFDEFGRQPYRVVRFADKTTGRDCAQLFKGLDANKIPHGQYDYVLERSDIRNTKLSTIRGGLYVYHPEHWLELNPSGNYGPSTRGDEVILELGGPPEVNIVGVVVPVPRSSDPVRVRLHAVHTGDRVEAEVGKWRISHL